MDRVKKENIIKFLKGETIKPYGKLYFSKDVLYVQDMAKHPLAKIDNGVLFMVLNITVKKEALDVLKIANTIKEHKNKILFVTSIFPDIQNIQEEDYHLENFHNMLYQYTTAQIFYSFEKMGLDFFKYISFYIKYTDTKALFNRFCEEKLVKCFTGKELKYPNGNYWSPAVEDWIITDKKIRDSLSNLERKIKIHFLLNG